MKQLELIPRHEHTAACFAQSASGRLLYTPVRADGGDRNLREVNRADNAFVIAEARHALTLTCTLAEDRTVRRWK